MKDQDTTVKKSKSHQRLYENGLKRIKDKNQMRKEMREKKEKMELQECTFKPRLVSKSPDLRVSSPKI